MDGVVNPVSLCAFSFRYDHSTKKNSDASMTEPLAVLESAPEFTFPLSLSELIGLGLYSIEGKPPDPAIPF